jgi:hypothetical protein
MLAMFLLTEAVTQLRGDAGARQKKGATTSLVHGTARDGTGRDGTGLTVAAHSTVVLSTESE